MIESPEANDVDLNLNSGSESKSESFTETHETNQESMTAVQETSSRIQLSEEIEIEMNTEIETGQQTEEVIDSGLTGKSQDLLGKDQNEDSKEVLVEEESEQSETEDSLDIAEELLKLEHELKSQIQVIRQAFAMTDTVTVREDPGNLAAILALYALRYDMSENFPDGVQLEDENAIGELRSIYWEATHVTAKSVIKNGETVAEIQIERCTPSELASKYRLSEEDAEWLLEMSTKDNEALVLSFIQKIN